MNAQELKTKSEDELKAMLLDLRREQMNQRFQRSNGALENTAQVRRTRRSIARVKTFLTQGQAGAAKSVAKAPAKAKKESEQSAKKAAPKKAKKD